MYKLFKKLAGISIFYSFANSIEALSPFFLAILLTRILTPQDYGIWVLFVSLMAFLRPVVNLTIQAGRLCGLRLLPLDRLCPVPWAGCRALR